MTIQISSKCVSVRLYSLCLHVCMIRLGEQVDGFAQLFLEVVGEVQGGAKLNTNNVS